MQTKDMNKSLRLLAVLAITGCFIVSAMSIADAAAPAPETKPVAQKAAFGFHEIAKWWLKEGPAPTMPGRKPVLEKAQAFTSTPMSEQQAEIYKSIFTLQEQGDIKAADRDIARLKDKRLMGHVLFQRYMHPKAYKSSYEELKSWLDNYADHPGADRIYRLANGRAKEESPRLKQPVAAGFITGTKEPTMVEAKTYVSKKSRTPEQKKIIAQYKEEIKNFTGKLEGEKALKKLQSKEFRNLLDDVEYDQLQGKIAAAFLYDGNTKRAAEIAGASVERSGDLAPAAAWIAGLAAWENGDYRSSAKYFEIPAQSPYASGWTASASSYWAARAHMRSGNVKEVSVWLKRAAEHPRTFYGLIATRALGRDFDFNWKAPTFTKEYYDALMNTPAGNRAIALVASGQTRLAEAELVRMKNDNETTHDALLAYAGYAQLPGLGMKLASNISGDDGSYYDSVLYPTGPWQPEEGYKIDPALIFAIARQESRFDPGAESSRGAMGLMQVMPATASAMVDDPVLDDPQQNLEIGQLYLETLLKDKNVKGDLVMLLVAYNAGPGNLARWKKEWPDVKDPLLFIELIPAGETRAYVERVLANFWIYRLREGQPTPTLDALAAGKTAQYETAQLNSYDVASAH